MANKLNNLLSFKDFQTNADFPKFKKTKRTDVGMDVLNENFYDKVAYKVKTDQEVPVSDFKNRLLKAAKSGQVTDLESDDGEYKFKVLNRDFILLSKKRKVYLNDTCSISFKTPLMDDWIKFEISKGDAEEIANALDDIEYL
ncbi:MAG: hypothetical protein KDH96_09440 [Candidatus Riesia sp.]|nr:hypothetical protein [Candidatus Riesia sp.]